MIRRYIENDALEMMELIESEGDEWSSYYKGDGKKKYLESLKNSITFVKVQDEKIIGYIRAIDDHGFDIYVCDLLVSKNNRGNHYGHELIEAVKNLFLERDIYLICFRKLPLQRIKWEMNETNFLSLISINKHSIIYHYMI